MGINIFRSSSMFDKGLSVSPQKIFFPNPDPNNYVLLEYREIGSYLLVKIKYLDCTNYEGEKILLFKDVTIKELQEQKSIDPHFSENKEFYSPIARFEPTVKGWEMGTILAMKLEELK